jgi:hypothetical protein
VLGSDELIVAADGVPLAQEARLLWQTWLINDFDKVKFDTLHLHKNQWGVQATGDI